MASKFFDKVTVSESSKRFVDKSFAISDRIVALLKQKNMTQRQLAEAMGKRESEISKWLTGTHNFTLNTISRLEEVLGEDITVVPGVWNYEISGKAHIVEDTRIDEKEEINCKNLNIFDWSTKQVAKATGEESGYAIGA